MYLGKFGRMGNQMFEISTAIGTAVKYNTEYTFNAWKYNKYYENPIPTGRNKSFRNYTEPCFHYKEIKFTDLNANWDLRGYYQTEKYFEHCKDLIKKHFTLKQEYVDYIFEKYPFLKDDNTCSIHVRRGDFLKFHEYHNTMPLEYFNRAIQKLYGESKGDINFIVCSDDIDWCKENLPKLNINLTFIEGEENVIDMHILSYCKDNIMSASSFSWWGAWLNDNPNKKVIAPKDWFGPLYKDKHDTKDLIPENWDRI
jgi:hypothetical protein